MSSIYRGLVDMFFLFLAFWPRASSKSFRDAFIPLASHHLHHRHLAKDMVVASTPRLGIRQPTLALTISAITAPCPIHAPETYSLPSPVANNSVSARRNYLGICDVTNVAHRAISPLAARNQAHSCDKLPSVRRSSSWCFRGSLGRPTQTLPIILELVRVNGSFANTPTHHRGAFRRWLSARSGSSRNHGDKLGDPIVAEPSHGQNLATHQFLTINAEGSAGGVLRGIWPTIKVLSLHPAGLWYHFGRSWVFPVLRGVHCCQRSIVPEWKGHLSVTQIAAESRLAVLFDANTSSWMSPLLRR
ncbi:uncharacterized protein ATNIH1004_002064 [Aspergillus tanneri]|uniref:Secreted protein n=1 Tax=Aspergillus tanneri TaxID=1220188 RepID=A0A5M9M8L6_9EURO|nr:uncharacterized protein ATNIH1004_002064 [Aspergillus tanneri]KAA8641263.1 hypothetical protein ATNIH1004_002064 [Aspergillus tanneri]